MTSDGIVASCLYPALSTGLQFLHPPYVKGLLACQICNFPSLCRMNFHVSSLASTWTHRATSHTCMHTHTHTHTHTQTHKHTHTHTRIHMHTQVHTHTHTCTNTNTHTCMRTHKHIHTHTQIHMHTYTHTYTHTHFLKKENCINNVPDLPDQWLSRPAVLYKKGPS